jgi:uncharacterized protein (DUF885 family)
MRFAVTAFLFLPCSIAQTESAWATRSNQFTQILIDLDTRYSPEDATSEGVKTVDEEITVETADRAARMRADNVRARALLQNKLAAETDPLVRQDLEILIGSVDRDIRSDDVDRKFFLPYFSVAANIHDGLHNLLDDQIAADRQAAAVVRLRKYVGLIQGFTPATRLAETRTREKLSTAGLLGPSKQKVEKDLRDTAVLITDVGLLLEKYHQKNYQAALVKLKEQLTAYDAFLRKEILPRSRSDFRLPPEVYANRLERYGVDYTPDELKRVAHAGFTEIQEQMKPLAAKIAAARKLPSSDYRDVIRELKKEQLLGPEIMPFYQKRLAEMEQIVRKNEVTLPARAALMRLASAAETARSPAPYMQPPPFLNNKGERGVFVLPLGTAGGGGEALKYDDFTYAAASWTLIAHELRPGHELQFDAMVEWGVSRVRALYAFNSVNAEGWGLSSEWMMLPYMPDEGKLISLQLRLQRAARAFLDPELQEGTITPEGALQVLQKDVAISRD